MTFSQNIIHFVPVILQTGSGAATLWAAKCTYLTQVGVWFASITGSTTQAVNSIFFGVFFMFFQTSK